MCRSGVAGLWVFTSSASSIVGLAECSAVAPPPPPPPPAAILAAVASILATVASVLAACSVEAEVLLRLEAAPEAMARSQAEKRRE